MTPFFLDWSNGRRTGAAEDANATTPVTNSLYTADSISNQRKVNIVNTIIATVVLQSV